MVFHRAKIKTNLSITFLNEPLISVKSANFLILDHSLTSYTLRAKYNRPKLNHYL